jgi:type I restriction enzyme S subunit
VWCRLGEVINIKSGKRIHASDYKDSGTPFLRSGEISSLGRGEPIKNQLYISQDKYEEIREKFGVPKPGDILIACIGGSIGNTWVVDDREFYYKDGNLVLLESIQFINTNYLLSYLSSPFFWNNTILNATSNSYNALTIVKLNHSIFPLPPQQEQQYIEKKIKSLFKKQDNLKSFNQENHENISLLDHVVLKEILKDKN